MSRHYSWTLQAATLLLASASSAQNAPPVQQQVTVTATRSGSPVGDTARTTYQLTPEALQNYPAVTLDESLRQHAGFELFRRAPSRIANPTSEGISLRGLGSTAASRTLVLEDGAPLNDPFGGWVHWNETPSQLIHSVEIVSGGGSDLYGSSALGGVIDVTPAATTPSRFEASAAAGAQDTSDLQLSAARKYALAGAQFFRTAGYIVTDPTLAGPIDTPANVRSQAYRTELGRREAATRRLFITGNLLDEDHHNGTPLQTNATRLWRYLGGYDTPETSSIPARVRLFASQEGYRQSFSAIAAGRASETLIRRQRVHTQELGATADATLHLGRLAFVTGADARDIRGEDNETPYAKGMPAALQDVTARQRFVGAFAEALAAKGSWSGAASLRIDSSSNLDIVQTTAATQAPNRNEILASPRIGVVRTLGAFSSLHASAFRAFRAPTMNELYRTGQVGQETTLANAGLLSERATGYELGAQTTHRLGNLSGTYFFTQINRPVSAVLVSQTATTITDMRQNLGQIRSTGVELFAQFHPGKPISAAFGYQFAAATVTKFRAQPTLIGNQIPQVPRQTGTAQLRLARPSLGELTLALRSSGTAFDDANNQFPLAGFLALDLSGTRTLSHHLEVFFVAQNLTNQRPQVSRTPLLTLGSPFFAEAGLRVHLGK